VKTAATEPTAHANQPTGPDATTNAVPNPAPIDPTPNPVVFDFAFVI
jgi:hypothetical protein